LTGLDRNDIINAEKDKKAFSLQKQFWGKNKNKNLL